MTVHLVVFARERACQNVIWPETYAYTVYLVISLPGSAYVRFWPTQKMCSHVGVDCLKVELSTAVICRQKERAAWPEPYIHMYIQCVYGISSREITIHTVIYGVLVQFWPSQTSCLVAVNEFQVLKAQWPLLVFGAALGRVTYWTVIIRKKGCAWLSAASWFFHRVGQDRICTLYMTVCMVISLLTIPYIHRMYVCVVLANPVLSALGGLEHHRAAHGPHAMMER
jgi:hypothetical protein